MPWAYLRILRRCWSQLFCSGGVRHPPLHRTPGTEDVPQQPAAELQWTDAVSVEREAQLRSSSCSADDFLIFWVRPNLVSKHGIFFDLRPFESRVWQFEWKAQCGNLMILPLLTSGFIFKTYFQSYLRWYHQAAAENLRSGSRVETHKGSITPLSMPKQR